MTLAASIGIGVIASAILALAIRLQRRTERACAALVFLGLTYEDVAGVLDCTEKDVRRYVHRARQRALRKAARP